MHQLLSINNTFTTPSTRKNHLKAIATFYHFSQMTLHVLQEEIF